MKFFKRFLGILFLVVLILGMVGLFFKYLDEENKREERENLVWIARCELETLRNDKEVLYLRLHDMVYEEDLLKLRYDTSISSDEVAKKYKDSLMVKDFMSVIILNPDKWHKVAQYLSEADVDLSITYLSHVESSFIISWEQLVHMLSDEKLFEEGIELFVQRKKKEVLEYARTHFQKDRYFKVDSLSLNQGFVSLHMSYDDSKASLGRSFLDTRNVSLHYTDRVGDMGSILNNILSICARTDRGFAFVYTAQKSRKVQSCKWDAKKAKEMYEDTADKLWMDKRGVNQVRTVIYKSKQ